MNEQEIREAVLAEKRRYYREYRAKNREKIKENNARYWARRAEKARERDAETVTTE